MVMTLIEVRGCNESARSLDEFDYKNDSVRKITVTKTRITEEVSKCPGGKTAKRLRLCGAQP